MSRVATCVICESQSVPPTPVPHRRAVPVRAPTPARVLTLALALTLILGLALSLMTLTELWFADLHCPLADCPS